MSGSRLGRYRLGARLGAGGAASVYLARMDGPHNVGRLAALKIIHDHLLDEREFVEMFLDEANLAVRLTHPNVVHFYELGRESELLFLAMEYLDGQPLSRLITRSRHFGRTIPLDLVAWIGARALAGLQHAHELRDDDGKRIGLVHRDVSPHNVFLTYDGQVKLIDFGIARAEGRLAHTAFGQIKGKFAYMAPEQALQGGFDHRADLFSLGVTLYEAALGARLFPDLDRVEALHKIVLGEIADPRTRAAGFPDSLATILMRSLEVDPDNRFQSAADMARELDAVALVFAPDAGHQERLGRLLTELFEPERGERAAHIAELKSDAAADFADQTHNTFGISATNAPPTGARRRKRRYLALGLGSMAVVVGIGVGLALRETDEKANSAAAAKSSTVTLEFRLQPEAPARIQIDGRDVMARPARIELPRSTNPIAVIVSADGYDRLELRAVPDRDQLLVLPLVRAPALSQPPTAATRAATAGAKPDNKSRHPAQPTDREKSRLIENYPF